MKERKWVCIPRKVLAHIPDLDPLQRKVVWYIIMRSYGYWSPKLGQPIPWVKIDMPKMCEETGMSGREITKTLYALGRKRVLIWNDNGDYIINIRAENWT